MRLAGHEVTERVGGIVAPNAILIGISFQDAFGVVGVVLKRREAINEAGTTLMDKEPGPDAGVGVAKEAEDFGPTAHPVGVGGGEPDAEVGVLPGDGFAGALAGEEVGTCHKAAEGDLILVDGGEGDPVALEHGFDGLGMTFGHLAALGVFIHDVKVAVAVGATEQDDGVVIEPIVQGGDPLDGARIVEFLKDMDITAEGGEVLAGGDTLQLNWPAGQGWRLQSQTNSLAVGISNNWGHVSGATPPPYNAPVNPANATVFYRLVWP